MSVARQYLEHCTPEPIQEHAKCAKSAPVWVRPGESVSINGVAIAGGMIYILRQGRVPNPDYWLIDVSLPIAKLTVADDVQNVEGHYTQYSSISPEARRGYLQWLAAGRINPHADAGYLFMFLGGLEQRALVDAQSDLVAARDIPQILAEAKRLDGIYTEAGLYRFHLRNFIDSLELTQISPAVYEQRPPEPTSSRRELHPLIKVALGQLSRDARPVPVEWALAWVLQSPTFQCGTPVYRCAAEFAQLFAHRYVAKFGAGLVLPQNKTKLRFEYIPTAFSLRGKQLGPTIDGLSDVTVMTSLTRKVQDLVEWCSNDLCRYSTHIGKNPESIGTLGATLKLPTEIWPAYIKERLVQIARLAFTETKLPTFGEITAVFKHNATLTKAKTIALVEALETLGLGMEPDVAGGAKPPASTEAVVLFEQPADARLFRRSTRYQAAELTVALGAMLVMASGAENTSIRETLSQLIDSWKHLADGHRIRLKAHLRHQLGLQQSVISFKKRIEALPAKIKPSIGQILATLAASGGTVTPDEVKPLERIYGYLELDLKLAYANLHIASSATDAGKPATSSPVSASSKTPTSAGRKLDMARIAQLQSETAQVSALLANVFVDDELPNAHISVEEPEEHEVETSVGTCLIGLDIEHSMFVRALITRQAWSRSDLRELADDMELMLDGALERINEATLDHLDGPLTEGDDPVEINTEIAQGITNEYHSSARS